ncbi:MAG: type IIL restriction-modification enzyme MmeI, partial [Dehalococcoidia bacterium]
SRIGNAFAFAFLPADIMMSGKTVVFPYASFGPFATLQSRIHEVWTRFLSTTLKDDLQYTPSLCFETFTFPDKFEKDASLEARGREYYEFRANLMVGSDEGLTSTYNRFHDPAEGDADILKLRELHDAMDRAVLHAYAWDYIETVCGFGLDYLDVEDEDIPEDVPELLWWPTAAEALAFAARLPHTRRRLPWRYRWCDDTRDEVLARLLELNKQRAEEERRTGAVADKSQRSTRKKRKAKPTGKTSDDSPGLFGGEGGASCS